MTVAFDLDGTLIHQGGPLNETPRYDVIQLYKLLESFGCTMYIWSFGGTQYAQEWADKLGLKATIIEKGSVCVDLTVDNEKFYQGIVNLVTPDTW